MSGQTEPAAPPSYQSLADELADFHDAEFQSAPAEPDRQPSPHAITESAPADELTHEGPAGAQAAAHAQMAHGDSVIVTVSAEAGRVSPPPPALPSAPQPVRPVSPSVRTLPVSRAPARPAPPAPSAQPKVVKPAPVRPAARLSSTSLLLLLGLVFISLAVVMLSYASSNTLSWPRRLWATTAISSVTARAADPQPGSTLPTAEVGLPRWAKRRVPEEAAVAPSVSAPAREPDPPTPQTQPAPLFASPSPTAAARPISNISPDSGADGPVSLITDTADVPVDSNRGGKRPRKGAKTAPKTKSTATPNPVSNNLPKAPAPAPAPAALPPPVVAPLPGAAADPAGSTRTLPPAPPLVSTNLVGVLARDTQATATPVPGHSVGGPQSDAPLPPNPVPDKPTATTVSDKAKASSLTDIEVPVVSNAAPKQPSSSIPKQPSPSAPKQPSPSIPKQPSPSTPKQPPPSAPKQPSPSAPKQPSPSKAVPSSAPAPSVPSIPAGTRAVKPSPTDQDTDPQSHPKSPIQSVPNSVKKADLKPAVHVAAADSLLRVGAGAPSVAAHSLPEPSVLPDLAFNALDDGDAPVALKTDATDLQGLALDSTGHVIAAQGADEGSSPASAKPHESGSLLDTLDALDADKAKPAKSRKAKDNSSASGGKVKLAKKKQKKSSKLSSKRTRKTKKSRRQTGKSRQNKASSKSGKVSSKSAKKTKSTLW